MAWVADRESLDYRMPLRLQVSVTDLAEDTTGNPSRFGMLGPGSTPPARRSRRSFRLIEPRSHKGKS